MPKISTTGPAITAQQVDYRKHASEEDQRAALITITAIEALNLAAEHLRSRLNEEQAPIGVLVWLGMCMDWVSAESGVSPLQCARAAAVNISADPDPSQHAHRVTWQKASPELEIPD